MVTFRWLFFSVMIVMAATPSFVLLTPYVRDMIDPINEWFEPKSVFVPNHHAGENPIIIYDRSIKKEFSASWTVTVRLILNQDQSEVACSNFGQNQYRANTVLPKSTSLAWFVGKPCSLQPGLYEMEARWRIYRSGYAPRVVALKSNQFQVF